MGFFGLKGGLHRGSYRTEVVESFGGAGTGGDGRCEGEEEGDDEEEHGGGRDFKVCRTACWCFCDSLSLGWLENEESSGWG